MKNITKLIRNMSSCRKYGVLVAEAGEKWGGADGVGKLFISVFKKSENEHWEYFKACEGELPKPENLSDFAGFITSGSIYSANDDLEWLQKLEDFYRHIRNLQKENENSPKLVGICFGHQIINKALGATVCKHKSGKFILQQNDIQISSALREKEFYRECLQDKSSLTIIQSHGEEVVNLPQDAKSFGHSDTCDNEIVLYDNDKILTFQGHCDFPITDAINIILPAIRIQGNFFEEDEKYFWKSVEKINENDKCVLLIRKFLGLD